MLLCADEATEQTGSEQRVRRGIPPARVHRNRFPLDQYNQAVVRPRLRVTGKLATDERGTPTSCGSPHPQVIWPPVGRV